MSVIFICLLWISLTESNLIKILDDLFTFQILETLLCLRVKADLIHANEEKGNKIERLKAKKEAIKKMSRKERKVCFDFDELFSF